MTDSTTLPQDPPRRTRRRRTGPELKTVTLQLQTVTPVFGGSAVPRRLYEDEPIRAASIRGHLRFWWRALYGDGTDSKALFERESALWGGIGDPVRRSLVEVCVRQVGKPSKDPSRIDLKSEGAYALWPARSTGREADAAPRWKPGLHFSLELRIPVSHDKQVLNTLRAWILFGGYGGRTRRGCGSLTFADARRAGDWLPDSATPESLEKLFGAPLPLGRPGAFPRAGSMPRLPGSRLLCSPRPTSAMQAWLEALNWLRDFRQGEPARQQPENSVSNRPGRSRWPEADEVRRLSRKWSKKHPPRGERRGAPAWPRAGFGLPIPFHFKQDDPRHPEPDDHVLYWIDDQGNRHERLASPLIVKAMPLRGERFVPIVLWLRRAQPRNGRLVLVDKRGTPVNGSDAPFEHLHADGVDTLFQPLRGKRSLEDAFFDWLTES